MSDPARSVQVQVKAFGDVDQLEIQPMSTPEPGPGEVLIRVTSIGLNHAELMARQGRYKLASGDPPFVPGLEAGGVIDAIGDGVSSRAVGQRVMIGVDASRDPAFGTYQSHLTCPAEQTVLAPDGMPDDQLGAWWLAYLTAWGCLAWRQQLQPGQVVAIPAASSSVGLAAGQIVKQLGGVAIGLTSSPDKVRMLRDLDEAAFDHLVCTRTEKPGAWGFELKDLTDGRGVDVFFDPVAAGGYLQTEILSLAPGGVIHVYGLLGEPGKVDVTPLIRKKAAIRGWSLGELADAGAKALQAGYQHVLDGFRSRELRLHVARRFSLADVREAHRFMEQGGHVGKLVMIP